MIRGLQMGKLRLRRVRQVPSVPQLKAKLEPRAGLRDPKPCYARLRHRENSLQHLPGHHELHLPLHSHPGLPVQHSVVAVTQAVPAPEDSGRPSSLTESQEDVSWPLCTTASAPQFTPPGSLLLRGKRDMKTTRGPGL